MPNPINAHLAELDQHPARAAARVELTDAELRKLIRVVPRRRDDGRLPTGREVRCAVPDCPKAMERRVVWFTDEHGPAAADAANVARRDHLAFHLSAARA